MNAQEFMEMQGEFAALIYYYENFLKKGQIIDLRYNNQFKDLLDQVNKYSEECRYMQEELKALGEKSKEEIKTMHEGFSKEYKENLERIENKHTYASSYVKRLNEVTKEDLEALDNLFKDYVLKYHPAVKLFVSKPEVELYNNLKRFYFENNYPAFNELFGLNADKIQFKELTDEDIIKISENYYNSRLRLNQEMAERKKIYPYIKESVLADEISLAQEEGEIKTSLNKLKTAHKKILEDYKLQFGVDFTL